MSCLSVLVELFVCFRGQEVKPEKIMVVKKLETDTIEEKEQSELSNESKKDKKARKRKKGAYKRIVTQTEFYLSDANLRHSKFLLPIYQKDPWIPLTLFLTFNKVSAMLSEIVEPDAGDDKKVEELVKALSYIESDSIELSSCKTKVSRKSPFIASSPSDIDNRTVYAENLPPDADHESIRNIFLPYGEVVYVSIPKFKSGRSKGFAFIEFKSSESVEKVVGDFTNVTVENKTELASVRTFNEEREETEVKQQPAIGGKRKNEDGSKQVVKRVKILEDVKDKSSKETNNVTAANNSTEIQVLSKILWKKLRNKYLDEQRKNLVAMKQTFKKSKTPKYVEKPSEPSDQVDIKPGVVVKVNLDAEIENVQEFKKMIKTALEDEKVGYVDAKVGHKTAFVRCEDSLQAKKLAETSIVGIAGKEILKGQEEKDYHMKAAKDKQEKRSGKVKVAKVKTRTKVLNKIENIKNSHVYFE